MVGKFESLWYMNHDKRQKAKWYVRFFFQEIESPIKCACVQFREQWPLNDLFLHLFCTFFCSCTSCISKDFMIFLLLLIIFQKNTFVVGMCFTAPSFHIFHSLKHGRSVNMFMLLLTLLFFFNNPNNVRALSCDGVMHLEDQNYIFNR